VEWLLTYGAGWIRSFEKTEADEPPLAEYIDRSWLNSVQERTTVEDEEDVEWCERIVFFNS
jgi:hypothetical protein